ncbi:hypothetical protein BKA62DRAFT_767821 [Auriculariales sp. MPI-PUGE-AT-0066]|nr:hypothetical protein BKA62DRAFT_767821 [Auriculariales sp. MPI-PUGE-AT-0066]
MSQFGRTFASASFASKRSYAQSIRLPTAGISSPKPASTYSNPGSPNAAFFAAFCGPHARTQVPYAGNPYLPAGISPASQPVMWAVEQPRSPSQLHFHMQQQQQVPSSPSQMQFNAHLATAPMIAAQTHGLFDFSFGFATTESTSPAFSGSPASSTRSVSPANFEGSSMAYPSATSFQPSQAIALTSTRKAKRSDDGKEGKKGLNPFTYYRKTFPARYPWIDALIPTQMERSRLTGAFWQHESSEVRQACEKAVYVDRTRAQIERLENIRLQTQEKRRQERLKAGTDRLEGRNALIFDLWQSGATAAQFRAAVEAHDRANPLPEPARKRRRKAPVRKLDADLLLAAERFSNASGSPQPSVSSLTHSPAAFFNPELPTGVYEQQDNWRNMVAQGGFEQPMPEVITVDLPAPLALTFSQPSSNNLIPTAELSTDISTLYDGMLAEYNSSPYGLGSDANMEALLDAYSFVVPSQQQHTFTQDFPTDMDHEFSFVHALPTEEDGLSFDVAYFGTAPHAALDA